MSKPNFLSPFNNTPQQLEKQQSPLRNVSRFLLFLVVTFALFGKSTVLSQGVSANGGATSLQGNQQVPKEQKETASPKSKKTGLQLPEGINVDEMTSPQNVSSTLKVMAVLTVLSLAPSILMMTTSFIRFVIVFGLLRQAMGTQQSPPNQVIVSLSLFLTLMVMSPVWTESYETGISPYINNQSLALQEPGESREERAFINAAKPLRQFMIDQIENTGNSDTVWMFIEYQKPHKNSAAAQNWKPPEEYDDVGLSVLLPAFVLSELKTAFVIGFQVYLPFVIIDMVVASVLISMGMMMMSPVMISLPFKLLLFIMIDGWFLTVGMLLESVAGHR
ncbi:Flagellar biosynthesis protein FliP [hydrothermal vent metagenome]|uniref:Flagellar biosynthetic protein FliP n=1 Tax=hydrothermal vent metagenome TaxID=652676 RepID=A0A3B1DR35_9ZZZZ